MRKPRYDRRFTPDQVREIRTLAKSGKGYAEIAPLFGVSIAAICYIAKRKSYKDVSDEHPEGVP